MEWIPIAGMKTSNRPIKILQHDETGRIKFIATVHMYVERVSRMRPS